MPVKTHSFISISILSVLLLAAHVYSSPPAVALTPAPITSIDPGAEPTPGACGGSGTALTCGGRCATGECQTFSIGCRSRSGMSVKFCLNNVNVTDVVATVDFAKLAVSCLATNPGFFPPSETPPLEARCNPPKNIVDFIYCWNASGGSGINIGNGKNFREQFGNMCTQMTCDNHCRCNRSDLNSCARACGTALREVCSVEEAAVAVQRY